MATYAELRALFADTAILEKVEVATIIAANNLLGGTPTAADEIWAAAVFSAPRAEGTKAMMAVLAENNTATVAQIQNASDATVQTQVNAVVPHLVAAYNAQITPAV